MFLLKELQLLRAAPPRSHQVRHANVAEDALNRLRRHSDVVHPRQPDLHAVRAKLVLESRLRNQRHDVLANPAPPSRGVLRHQSGDALALPVAPPLPDGHSRQPKVPTRRLDAEFSDVFHDRQALLHPQPVLSWNPWCPFHHPSRKAPHYEALEWGLFLSRSFTSHQVRGPRGGTSEARCRVTVHARHAELDYEAFGAFNRARGMYLGVLRLHFADADRTQLVGAEWKDKHEAAFHKAQVEPIQYTLERAVPYLPGAVGSTKALRPVRERPGQQRFRADLKMAYGCRCCISGCTVSETLEAAHIDPYGGNDFDHLQNGLLLRLDLHRLFDAGKLAVEPTTREVHLSE
jgi:hypothetical protein